MLNELQLILTELERLNEQLAVKLFTKDQILEEKYYISDLPELQEEIKTCLAELHLLDRLQTEQVVEKLIELHIKLCNSINRIEQVHELVEKMIANYGKIQA